MSVADSMILNAPAPDAARESDGARRPWRVLMIVESAAGGTGRHVLDLCEGFIARGCDAHVIYSTGRVDRMFLNRLAKIPALHQQAIRMRTAPHPSDVGVVRAVKRYMREHGPFDVIHGHSSKGGAIARLAAFGTGIPAFYTLHGLIMMDPGLPRWKWLMYYSAEMAMTWRTQRIIAVSPEEQRAARKLGFGHDRVTMVPNGVGPLGGATRKIARQTMGVAEDQIVIGFIGRLVEQKAPHILIEAFANTLKVTPNARLAIVGAGPLEREMHDLATRLGAADKIIWLGERDARGVIAGFDLFALSSRKEGLPYVVLEAMVTGLPVVATNKAGVEILIDPGVSGEVVPADDAKAFGDALIRLTSDPARLAAQSKAAGERAKRFTVDAMVEGTIQAYEGALSPSPGTPGAGRGEGDFERRAPLENSNHP
ncbi:MAG TPA: glycosyltransferase, partial [Tepidisphaeraceae bacterium]|nr:glycosyltransferase [Tepidisphaeraceae bacterium]